LYIFLPSSKSSRDEEGEKKVKRKVTYLEVSLGERDLGSEDELVAYKSALFFKVS
jgi:hypothetical protein